MWWGRVRQTRDKPTQSLGHVSAASFIPSQAYLKVYLNISYFKSLLKFFLLE